MIDPVWIFTPILFAAAFLTMYLGKITDDYTGSKILALIWGTGGVIIIIMSIYFHYK